jgi:hypothetical protein
MPQLLLNLLTKIDGVATDLARKQRAAKLDSQPFYHAQRVYQSPGKSKVATKGETNGYKQCASQACATRSFFFS